MTIELIPAERFSLQELTDLYNQTRVDYLVPMPMNASRLGDYVTDFDICVQRLGCTMRRAAHDQIFTRLDKLLAQKQGVGGQVILDHFQLNLYDTQSPGIFQHAVH